MTEPLLVAIRMGYGHLRPAHALSKYLGVEVRQADEAPLASIEEQARWRRLRSNYEGFTRLSQARVVGGPLRALLKLATRIPAYHDGADDSGPTPAVRVLDRHLRAGLCSPMVDLLKDESRPLLTTHFIPALAADLAGCEDVYCVVTDSDVNRIWVGASPASSGIQYLAPSKRVVGRLQTYGVPSHRIRLTGYPLPPSLLGGPGLDVLKRILAARLVRLDPEGAWSREGRARAERVLGPLPDVAGAVHLTYAVGGAGAQANLVTRFLPSLRPAVLAGDLVVTLVAGVRPRVRDTLLRALTRHDLMGELGSGVHILFEPTHDRYFQRFNELLARTDILWTKPSEMTFFSALGLPTIFSRPVGVHEARNRDWVLGLDAGIPQGAAEHALEWIQRGLRDGGFARAAFNGFLRLPKTGLFDICELVTGRSPQVAG